VIEIPRADQAAKTKPLGSSELSPEVRDWLKKNGVTESDFRTAVQRTVAPRHISKPESELAEWDRIQRANFAYEKSQREARAKGR
jgi:hypothetical protein